MSYLIGFEIDWNIIRASVIDSESMKIVKYEDRINLSPVVEGFLDPSEAIKQVWETLDLDAVDNHKVSVSIGLEQAGMVSSSDHKQTARDIEERIHMPISWLSLDKNVFGYIRSDYMNLLNRIFRKNQIPLNRIELAPQALIRVMKRDYSGQLTLTSGAGWKISVEKGVITDAETSVDILSERGVKIVTKKSIKDVIQIRNIEVPDELLAKYQIEISDLFVSAGTALSLVNEKDTGFLETVTDDVEVVEIDLSDRIDIDYDEGKDYTIDTETDDKKSSGIFGKFRKN